MRILDYKKYSDTAIDLVQKFDTTAQLIQSLDMTGENRGADNKGIEAFASVISTLPHHLNRLGVREEVIANIADHELQEEITKRLSEAQRASLAKLIDCKNGLASGAVREIGDSWGKVVHNMKSHLAILNDEDNIAWKLLKNNKRTVLAMVAGSIGLYGAYRLLCKQESEEEKPKEKNMTWWKILLLGGIISIALGFGIGSLLGLEKIKKYLKDKWGIDVNDATLNKVLHQTSGGNFDQAYALLTKGRVKEEELKVIATEKMRDLKKTKIALTELTEKKNLLAAKMDIETEVKKEKLSAVSAKIENKSLRKAYESANRVAKNFKSFEKNYPQEYKSLQEKHPDLMTNMSLLSGMLIALNRGMNELNESEIRKYNDLAAKINEAFNSIHHETESNSSNAKEAPFDEASLTTDQKKQLKKFADDVYDMLFPESYTDKFVQWSTGQTGRLNDADRLAAAPMNGIESAVKGILSLLNPETYYEMYKSAHVIAAMSYEDWSAMMETVKLAYKNTSTSNKIAPVMAFLSSLAMLGGGLSKLGKVAQSMGYSKKILIPLDALIISKRLAPAGKLIHVAEITGETLPYITPQN